MVQFGWWRGQVNYSFFFSMCVCVDIYIYNQIDMIHGHMVILIPKLQGP